jgi:hypothetical protein
MYFHTKNILLAYTNLKMLVGHSHSVTKEVMGLCIQE